ncbi:MAG: outer membrane beta-barrel protein [Dysgonomonas sp.]
MNKRWSDNLHRRMDAHKEPSPEGLWEDIEQIMKREGSVFPKAKQNKILLWGKRIGAVAAIVLAMLFIGDYLLNKNIREAQIVVKEIENENKLENNIFTHRHNNSKLIVSNNKTDGKSKNNLVASAFTEDKGSLSVEDEESLVYNNADNVEEYKEEAEGKDSDNLKSKKKNFGYNNKMVCETDLIVKEQDDRLSKWETSIYASNISSNSEKKHDGYGSFISGEIPFEGDCESPTHGENPQGDILLQNKYREVYTDIKHRQPIIIGLSAIYNLDAKWSLSSGLTYTILSSQLRSGSDSYYYTSEQTLHNIGIPLNIHYNVWESKKVSIYLSTGGLVEKNVSAKLKTNYIVDNQFRSSREDEISVDQLQWSLNTSVGLQYNFSPRIGLYTEPGVSYYFNNGSEIETIYKENPVNMSLKFGLRFSLN